MAGRNAAILRAALSAALYLGCDGGDACQPRASVENRMRQFLIFGLPILTPVAVYLLWFAHATQRANSQGLPPPRLGDAPWAWVIGAGVALAAFVLGILAFQG